MRLTVNGAGEEHPEGRTLADLVESRTRAERGVAVTRNGEVVPRAQWPGVRLADGDVLELLTATAGG